MKKNLFMAFAMLVACFASASCSNETVIDPTQLPAAAQTFLNQHFPQHTILHTLQEGGARKEYDVKLTWNNATFDVDFNHLGEATSVESKDEITAIPTSFILANIVTYCTNNYPQAAIVGWSKDRNHYDIELSNHLDLVFDLNGNFQRIDK